MAMPDVEVSIAFDSGYLTPAASRTWTDVSTYVEGDRGIDIQRGRPDQFSVPQPSRLSLTLDNKDGRFTPEYVSGAYYPNVKKGRPIRVRVKPIGAGAYVERFVGYIDEWPVEWPDTSSSVSTVTISATSRQARLGRSAAFKSIIEEECLYDGPVLYFPLGEPSGATAAGNIAPGRTEVLTATQVGTGGTLAFGAGTGPGTDDLTAPVFTPVDANNGLYLLSPLLSPLPASGDTVIDVELWFTQPGADGPLFYLLDPSGDVQFAAETTGGGFVNVGGAVSSGSTGRLSSVTVNDGLTHHLSARLQLSGGNLTASLMLDGAARLADATPLAGVGTFPAFTRLIVGRDPVGSVSMFTGTIAHVVIYSGTVAVADARIAQHYSAGANGFTSDASGARIQRYARLAGIPTAEVSTETGLSTSIAHKDTTGNTPVSLMQDVATTEDGVVFDGKDGTLTFHARSHRYNVASAFTLSVAAGDVQGGLRPTLDDQNVVNDMTASRPDGVTIRSVNQDSIDGTGNYGYYKETVEILTTSDNEVQSRADWAVNRFGTPRVTVPNISVDLVTCSSGLITSLVAADIGTRFAVTGLPSQAPASTMDSFIEGITEKIGVLTYVIEFNVSPAAYATVWQLDSATLSQLDSTTVLAY